MNNEDNNLLRLVRKSEKLREENSSPRYANSGVSKDLLFNNTAFNVCIDWVTVSFNYDYDSFCSLFKFMGLNPNDYVEDRGTFNVQYSYLRTYNEFIKVYLPADYMNDNYARVCMELSGQACRLLELINQGNDWFWCSLFCIIHSLNGKCSRCDLALDDFNGNFFTIYDLFAKVIKGEYTCNSDTWNVVAKGTRSDEDYSQTGFTIYLGSTSSERQLCIYNKKSERKTNGYEVFTDYWVRYELRLKKDTANTLFNKYLIVVDFWNDFSKNVCGLLKGFVDFKENMNYGSTSRSKSKTWQPWLDFLKFAETIKVKNQAKTESTISVKKSWYQSNYSNFMNEIALGDIKGFDNYVSETLLDRLNDFDFSKKRLDRVNNYRLSNGLGKLTSIEFISYINKLRHNNNLPELSLEDKYKWKCLLFDNEL